MNEDKPTVKLTGNVRISPNLPDDFDKIDVGDIVITKGYPHVVIDAGEEQGKRIAGFIEVK